MYSKLLFWEVQNFMAVANGRCDFDERGIVNLKGYNESGKSTMITALKVLLYNAYPSKQVGFIRDGSDYFRIVAGFDDGVQILRDKYANGQSLYEMTKDGVVVFSTRKGRTLTRVVGVPEPIETYLGLLSYGDTYLNARSCFEKRIGIETSGSENYKMFSSVLRAEETASAYTMLNNDRNKLVQDIAGLSYRIEAEEGMLGEDINLSEGLVSGLCEADAKLDGVLGRESGVQGIAGYRDAEWGVVLPPEVPGVDLSGLESIAGIRQCHETLCGVSIPPSIPMVWGSGLEEVAGLYGAYTELCGVSIPPVVPTVSEERLAVLRRCAGYASGLAGVRVEPGVPVVSKERLTALSGVLGLLRGLRACGEELERIEAGLTDATMEMDKLSKELPEGLVRCPGCGQIFDPEEGHVHV